MLGVFATVPVPVPSTNFTPSFVTLKPPVASLTTNPLLSSLLLPAVTLSTVRSFFMLTVTVLLPVAESWLTSVVKFEVS